MRRFEDCIRKDGLCGICSLSSYGNDCQGQPINRVLYHRSIAGLTQAELAKESGINIRQIQKYESGEYDIGNMTLKNAVALADILECDVSDLWKR